MELHKDVEIKGVKYRIGRFTARTGSWVLAQLLTKMLPAAIEGAFSKVKLAPNRTVITEAEFESLQGHALAVCGRYEAAGPMPIIHRDSGKFAIKELEYDLAAVMALTVHAMVFNLSSFFEDDGLSLILGGLPLPALGLSSSDSQA